MLRPDEVAARLKKLHQRASWREIAKMTGVPPGTLCRIAKSGGEFLPRKWMFRLGARDKKSLFAVTKKELKWMFENRVSL